MKHFKQLSVILALLLCPVTVRASDVFQPNTLITVISQSGIPFIKASSGTMGNNGAVSLMTAMLKTYSNGAYLYLPAGAVAAGVPAAPTWYWFVASSTTAGTVYNSTYTSGTPTVGTTTAFATTGPGVFLGVTTAVTAVSLTLPANSLGTLGRLEAQYTTNENGTAGNKTLEFLFGGSTVQSLVQTTQQSVASMAWVQNRGATNVQTVGNSYSTSSNSAGVALNVDIGIDTTAAVTVSFRLTTAVATDYQLLDQYRIEVRRAP